MSKMRKKYSAGDKAKIALEALKGDVPLNQLTAKYQVHSTQINSWKKRLKEGVVELFKDQRSKENHGQEGLIEPAHSFLSIETQCNLLNLPRSSFTIYRLALMT